MKDATAPLYRISLWDVLFVMLTKGLWVLWIIWQHEVRVEASALPKGDA